VIGRAIQLLLLAVLAMGMSGCIESRVFYFPSREPFETPRDAEDVAFESTDGLRLHGWFLRASDAAPGERRPTILHVHGNAGNLSGHIEFSRWLRERGFHVLAFDYRGFGRSDQPTRGIVRADLLADARAALAYAQDRPDVDGDRIGVLGVSVGGVIGLALAAESPGVRCVVSVSAFSSWKGIANEKMPILGGMLLPRGLDAVDSAARLGSRPLLIVHGDADTIVPVSHAGTIETAARRAGVPVRSVVVPGVGHNDILIEDEATQDAVAAFLHISLK
jgi:uncharacterized protein